MRQFHGQFWGPIGNLAQWDSSHPKKRDDVLLSFSRRH
jgi:hypothetical protein